MVRCLTCKRTERLTKRICWQRWQLCGDCARKEHPEYYKLGKKFAAVRNSQRMKKEKLKQ
jgi:negative regulator of sigma E activity